MQGVTSIEPSELYNLLQGQEQRPLLSHANNLLLLDCRPRLDYEESHIVTARRCESTMVETHDGTIAQQFIVPYGADLDCCSYVVTYDGSSTSHDMKSAAYICATTLWDHDSRNPVHVLKGGYETFSALYPFLRTQKIMFSQRELDAFNTYPCEILYGRLYLGNFTHSNLKAAHKDLKIVAQIACDVELNPNSEPSNEIESNSLLDHILPEKNDSLPQKTRSQDAFSVNNILRVQLTDDASGENIIDQFPIICKFIDEIFKRRVAPTAVGNPSAGSGVLIWSEREWSRASTCIIAYLLHLSSTIKTNYQINPSQLPPPLRTKSPMTLEEIYSYVKRCCPSIRPNRGYMEALINWEGQLADARRAAKIKRIIQQRKEEGEEELNEKELEHLDKSLMETLTSSDFIDRFL